MGGRNLTPEMVTASRARVVRPIAFVRLDLDSGVLRLTNQSYNFIWDDEGGQAQTTWLGTHGLGRISGVQTGVENRAYTITMELSGIPVNERMSLILSEPVHGRKGWMWRGLLDEGHKIIPSPKLWFGGWIDTMNARVGLTEAAIMITIANDLIDWERSKGVRFNDQSQQARYPGDTFFKKQPSAMGKQLVWGQEWR